MYSFDPIPELPLLTESEIQVVYMQMFNSGQMYMGRLGQPPISIDEWRKEQLQRIGIVA